jgi:hypothetical protein
MTVHPPLELVMSGFLYVVRRTGHMGVILFSGLGTWATALLAMPSQNITPSGPALPLHIEYFQD